MTEPGRGTATGAATGNATGTVVAVDIGATSGRVIIGHVGPDELRLEQVARFPNTPVTTAEDNGAGLHWDIHELDRNVMAGLRAAGTAAEAAGDRIASIGIDAWAVDYALMRGGRMIGTPFHYRDERTAAGVEAVHALLSFDDLYTQSGLQFLPFNTIYQLTVDKAAGAFERARTILLIPDLFTFWLTGVRVAEVTNASTTGLLKAGRVLGSRKAGLPQLNRELIETLGLPQDILSRLVNPGYEIGPLLPDVASELGYDTTVTAVGSHDTASAVVAVPMTDPDAAYISCGTWGLVGVELDNPVLSDAARDANFTNERGVDGRIRFLHNVMGLWLLSESMRTWEHEGLRVELAPLLAEAAALRDPVPIFDANDPRFLAPGDMPARIADWCREHGQPVPQTQATFARSILESLADAFARAAHTAAELSGKRVSVIHLVGGGSQNELLCQLTADRSGLPVLAGPVEATAIGNVLVQARAVGLVRGDLETLRALVARTHPPRRYKPRGDRSC
ncbi:rhamnulokinase [Rathayibacter soli]|uniref:rhamnulokinase n=1 Tax=Rathayibacter soli TaxID=3144168 RepID=UPI0027E515DD|nr:rhamnulokinase family protein [Glaciibacter superstes]